MDNSPTKGTTAVQGKLAYTIPEAVEATSLSRDTLYRRHRVGDITMRKVGGRTLISAADLMRLIEDAPAVPRSAA
jgi:excisionase family DNA binding protein